MKKIIAAAMNQVSTVEFANACDQAGFWSSVSLYMYPESQYADLVKQCPPDTIWAGSQKYLDALPPGIEFVEIQLQPELSQRSYVISVLDKLKKNGTKIIFKLMSQTQLFAIKYADIVILKSTDGGGWADDWLPMDRQIKMMNTLNLPFYMSGGITNKKDIQKCLDMGAGGVSVGTLIASSVEAPIHPDAKQRLIGSKGADTVRYNTPHRGIIFTELDNLDFNHTASLKEGVTTGNTGHIYCGKGVGKIKKILPLKDIYQSLV